MLHADLPWTVVQVRGGVRGGHQPRPGQRGQQHHHPPHPAQVLYKFGVANPARRHMSPRPGSPLFLPSAEYSRNQVAQVEN